MMLFGPVFMVLGVLLLVALVAAPIAAVAFLLTRRER
jgi:hypothetical protein